MEIKYSFSLSPPPPAISKPAEKLVEYSYNEFFLDLPYHWTQVPTPEENSFNWHSDVEKASITVSADFYDVPEEKAQRLAEECLRSRAAALERMAPGKVVVLSQSIKPHSGGVGLEVSFNAEIPGNVYLYLGYVTSRKVFNFTLVSGRDRFAAAGLYNKTMGNVSVMLP